MAIRLYYNNDYVFNNVSSLMLFTAWECEVLSVINLRHRSCRVLTIDL